MLYKELCERKHDKFKEINEYYTLFPSVKFKDMKLYRLIRKIEQKTKYLLVNSTLKGSIT